MTKNQVHEWHERREDGKKVYYRGYWNSREWRMGILEPEIEGWQPIEAPSGEMWLALRDVLFRKYQRKRVPHKMVVRVDGILAEFGLTAQNGTPPKSEIEDDYED